METTYIIVLFVYNSNQSEADFKSLKQELKNKNYRNIGGVYENKYHKGVTFEKSIRAKNIDNAYQIISECLWKLNFKEFKCRLTVTADECYSEVLTI